MCIFYRNSFGVNAIINSNMICVRESLKSEFKSKTLPKYAPSNNSFNIFCICRRVFEHCETYHKASQSANKKTVRVCNLHAIELLIHSTHVYTFTMYSTGVFGHYTQCTLYLYIVYNVQILLYYTF